MFRLRKLLFVLSVGTLVGSITSGGSALARDGDNNPLSKIKHIVVIYEENHSFDNLYGGWEGVNGLSNGAAQTLQVGQASTRTPYTCLMQNDANLTSPPVTTAGCTDATTATAFTSHFTNAPFQIDTYIKPGDTTCPLKGQEFSKPNGWLNGTGAVGGCTRDIVHRFYQEQYQIDGGRQDRYTTGSDAVGLTQGYYDTKQLPIYAYLHGEDHPNYAIADNFFQAAFGGSFLNHQWLIAAATPVDNSPGHASLHSLLDSNGMPVARSPVASQSAVPLYVTPPTTPPTTLRDGAITSACPAPLGLACGDFAVNTMQPFDQPFSSFGARLPAQTAPTIGDRLSKAGVDWAWYAGGWANAAGARSSPGWTNGFGPVGSDCIDPNVIAGSKVPYCPDRLFQFHHQPFAYYANYGPNGAGRSHLQDELQFTNLVGASAKGCQLKPVSFVKPIGEQNEHPGYASEANGSDHLRSLLQSIENSRCAKDTMVVVTYDEFGGQWDHVSPPGQGIAAGPHDWWGPGTRIPALVLAPRLQGSFVIDSAQHDTTSILSTIEHRFGLRPLGTRDAAVTDLSTVFSARPFEEDQSGHQG